MQTDPALQLTYDLQRQAQEQAALARILTFCRVLTASAPEGLPAVHVQALEELTRMLATYDFWRTHPWRP